MFTRRIHKVFAEMCEPLLHFLKAAKMPGWLVILFLFSLTIDNFPCDNNFTKRYSMNFKKVLNIKVILSNGGLKEINRIMNIILL